MRSTVLISCLHSDITINWTLEYPIITTHRQNHYLVDKLKNQQALSKSSFTHVLVGKISSRRSKDRHILMTMTLDSVLTSIGNDTNFCSVILRYERSAKHKKWVTSSTYHARTEKNVKRSGLKMRLGHIIVYIVSLIKQCHFKNLCLFYSFS